MKTFFTLLLLFSSQAFALTTTIKDPINDDQARVIGGVLQTSGSGGGGGLVDQGAPGTEPWPVSSTPATVSTTSITNITASAGSSVTLVASNPSRLGLTVYDQTGTNCYVALNVTSTSSSFSFIMFPLQTYNMESPIYTGALSVNCTNNGILLITEY